MCQTLSKKKKKKKTNKFFIELKFIRNVAYNIDNETIMQQF